MPQLPCLPGFSFDNNIGRKKFNRSQYFDKLHEGVYYLTDKSRKHSSYPSFHTWGEVPPNPPWLLLDGQRLMFHAYFQENIHGVREPYRVRPVNISFFLEDGTMKVSEPRILNSGLDQGVLVKRQRIPMPDPVKYRYYDIIDLNIGKEPSIYGKVFKIVNCDDFTRRFLNNMGIPVPDPLEMPVDIYSSKRATEATVPKHVSTKQHKLKNFLKYDRKVLRFYGFWDDSENPYGYVHQLDILYYLADDTMEITEKLPVKYGSSTKRMLVKKMKIPKIFKTIEPIGSEEPIMLLNVLGESIAKSHYVVDNSHSISNPIEYYKDCDLTIGAHLNVFNRKVVITEVDNFTKEYYMDKYGLDDFTSLNRPERLHDDHKLTPKFIPPYNGYGSYEDTLLNSFRFVPKRPKGPTAHYYNYENQVDHNKVLRFGAIMISDEPAHQDKYFVLNIFLADKTIAIVDVGKRGKGHSQKLFQKKSRIRLPGEETFTSEEPKYYEPQDFYIGNIVTLHGFKFEIDSADEFTFKYMEEHADEFPLANVHSIMNKIREGIRPMYREFITNYAPLTTDDQTFIMRLPCLREALYKYLGGQVVEHEIISIARHYSLCVSKDPCPREYVRALVHTELTRSVWNDLERLNEDIHEWDKDNTGYLDHNQIYTIFRANRVPLEKELIHLMLSRLKTNDKQKICCEDLLRFIDIKVDPIAPVLPTNLKVLYWTIDEKPKDCNEIKWCSFIKDLDLDGELTRS